MTRVASCTLLVVTVLVGISCGSRIAPRLQQIPAEYSDSAEYRQAYTAFWWNCAIVKSVDLGAPCPKTCGDGAAEAAGCAAGAADAENQIAELEKEHGPERAQEMLSFRIADEDGHSQIASHFPYGPKPASAGK